MKKTSETFLNTTEVLDGNQYEQCTFQGCRVIYRGGDIPSLVNCHFDQCRWQFDDAALRTVSFLQGLYHGLGPAGSQMVEATFDVIRKAPPTFVTPPENQP